MREILFRGQTRRKGEKVWMDGSPVESNWVYGGVLKGHGDHSIIYQTEPDIEKKVVYTDTLGQFVGQMDSEGRKIFEGDIIQYDGDYDGIDGFTRSISEKAIVLWDEDYCGFVCKVIGDESGDSYSWLEYRENPDLTIIGNIYDNPELVKDAIQEE